MTENDFSSALQKAISGQLPLTGVIGPLNDQKLAPAPEEGNNP
jgi:hypothetical protein